MKFYLNKSFGYPVLQTLAQGAAADTLDYPTGEFQVSVDAELSEERLNQFCFSYNFITSVWGLKKAVEKKKAAYFLRVQCPDTYFSQAEQVPASGKLFIPAHQLRGETEVAAFIVAIKDATITSDQIHKDFGIKKFSVKAGMVLAHHYPTLYYIEKDCFRPITAVMEFIESKDKTMKEGEFKIVLGVDPGDPVNVEAHPEQIRLFKNALGDGGGSAILMNSVCFVAVMEMFRALINEYDSYKDTRWGKVLIAKYDGEINKKMNIVKATQTILKQPLRSLNERFYSQLQP